LPPRNATRQNSRQSVPLIEVSRRLLKIPTLLGICAGIEEALPVIQAGFRKIGGAAMRNGAQSFKFTATVLNTIFRAAASAQR